MASSYVPPPQIPARPLGRGSSRLVVVALVLFTLAVAVGGAWYFVRSAEQHRAEIGETGPGNANAAPGFGVTDGEK